MLTDFYQKHKGAVLTVSTILAVLIVGWVMYYNFILFHISSISPNPNSASYLSPRLVVGFNKELATNAVKVTSNNTTLAATIDGTKLTITLPGNLEGDKTYPIVISSVSSKSGDVIKNYTISLHTVLNSNSLSADDKQIILDQQQAAKSPILNDPIFNYVPHSTLDYTIDSVINNADTKQQGITLTITVNLSAADVKTDSNAAIAQYQQEAMDYLNSLKGININNYNIEVKVTDPTL